MKSSIIFEYKGFTGSQEISMVDACYHGKITNIDNDLVTYEADTPDNLKIEFEKAVDDHIHFKHAMWFRGLSV